jgi:hypothetical protein
MCTEYERYERHWLTHASGALGSQFRFGPPNVVRVLGVLCNSNLVAALLSPPHASHYS